MRSLAILVMIAAVIGSVSAAHAAPMIRVPSGTSVPLKFVTPVDSSTITQGAVVQFEVATDVLMDRYVVLRRGAPAQGVVTDVSGAGIFGKDAVVHIGFIETTAADGRPVRLSPIAVTPGSVREAENVGAAGASSLAGAIVLGPLGLAAGALIHGGHVAVPAGAVATSKLEHAVDVAIG